VLATLAADTLDEACTQAIPAIEQDVMITNVSHGKVVLRVNGPLSRDLLAKSCPVDLHPRHFAPGCCARSLVADVPMVIHAYEVDGFDLYMDRSIACSAIELLVEQTAEFTPMTCARGAT
jgi:sarcosine oxidase subunit gamma